MKFETTASLLLSALRVTGLVVERRNTLPILGTVLFDGNRLRATDLDIEVNVNVPSVFAKGSVAIDHRSLLNLVRHIPADDTVRIEGDKDGVTVSFGAGRYDLASLPTADWPSLDFGPTTDVAFDGAGFEQAINFCAPFISGDETRYYLNGVCLDGDVAVSTDGHRLACHPLGFDASPLGRMIVPRKTVAVLRNLPAPKAMRRATSKAGVRFRMDGLTLTSKTIDGTYPDWRRIIPNRDGASTLTINRSELLRVTGRIASAIGSRTPYVALAFDREHLAIVSRRLGEITAREYLAGASIIGGGHQVGFNAAYLRDLLRIFAGSETITLSIVDKGTPIIAKAGDSDAYAVLMPARIGDEKLAVETLSEWSTAQGTRRAA